MPYINLPLLPGLVITVFILACFTPKEENRPITYQSPVIEFCTKNAASKHICRDEKEFFFQHINSLDIALQMKTGQVSADRDNAINNYKTFLADQTLEFSSVETEYLTEILKDCFNQIIEVNSSILPDSIFLIKVDGNGFGEGVFYTRENAIIIPKDELGGDKDKAKLNHLKSVMYHELFHIISKNNEALKLKLYHEIGFEKLNAKLIIPESLGTRKLLNPDGVDVAYFVRLTSSKDQRVKLAIPIIRSNEIKYIPEKPEFFSYVDFDLFEIEQMGESTYHVICDIEGSSLLENEYKLSFFQQIGDNTDYIIHPDEIIADNFTYALRKEDLKKPEAFSDEGKALIGRIRAIISNTN